MTDTPSIDVAVAKYDQVAAQIRDIVVAEYPGAAWSEGRPAGQSGGDAPEQTRRTSPIWVVDVPLADDAAARDRVVEAADKVLTAAGIDGFAVVVARPGDFEYVAGDAWGVSFNLGGMKNVTLSYETGSLPKN
ncbi:LppA family lipoprotein [Microbacterium sp. CJ88]|uniref:LppA family lipoprotein n=1 Tax=Microbacterium sp. CJ88 TaxID=3445672 RepID=UPI003F65867D